MEMDQTNVEIRWGNCEKMADVLTREIALWSRQEDGCKKTRSWGCLTEFKKTFAPSKLSFGCFVVTPLICTCKWALNHDNTAMLLIPICSTSVLVPLWIAVYSDYTTQPSLSLLLPMAFWWTPSLQPLFGLTSAPLSVNLKPSSYWLEMLCWSNGMAVQLAGELRGGRKELIYLWY